MVNSHAHDPLEQLGQQVLDAAFPLVPFDGWTDAVLQEALDTAGIPAAHRPLLFPEGISDLVEFFCRENDRKMLESPATQNLSALRVRERIATLVKTRILLQAKNPAIVAKTLAYYALPNRLGEATASLCKTVDVMWYAAGDNATDFNYYSKRFLLAGVYSSTLLYWISDTSEDYHDSWRFLDDRIGNIMEITKWKGKLKSSLPPLEHIPFLRLLWRHR
ncbi:MAG: hypothetical protein K0R63_1514 [Rickettsiales bacterium]|jgi:ubiquinone biosynthesis protein COQ9|nr:hypothetical protein [Rickettsiales bacterium]